MIRYPIFMFKGEAFEVYNTPEEHWNNWEAYSLEHFGLLFDSNGHVLSVSDAGHDRVRVSDSGAEPDRERLRALLIHALEVRGQELGSDAPIETLIRAAQAKNDLTARSPSIGEVTSKLLRRLRLKRPAS